MPRPRCAAPCPGLRSSIACETCTSQPFATGSRAPDQAGKDMKITAIRTLVVNAEMRNWVFVKVETDQDGLFGWGEATLEWKTRAVVGCVEDLAPLVVGLDPRDIENAVRTMTKHGFWKLGVIGDRHLDRQLFFQLLVGLPFGISLSLQVDLHLTQLLFL